jgi:hypothetical protein
VLYRGGKFPLTPFFCPERPAPVAGISKRWATRRDQSAGSVTVRWSLRDAARPKRFDLITSREFISIVAPQTDHLKDMWYK